MTHLTGTVKFTLQDLGSVSQGLQCSHPGTVLITLPNHLRQLSTSHRIAVFRRSREAQSKGRDNDQPYSRQRVKTQERQGTQGMFCVWGGVGWVHVHLRLRHGHLLPQRLHVPLGLLCLTLELDDVTAELLAIVQKPTGLVLHRHQRQGDGKGTRGRGGRMTVQPRMSAGRRQQVTTPYTTSSHTRLAS